MATKFGFNVKIGADTTAFSTALRNLNTPIRDAQNSIKRLTDGLKLNPTNVDIIKTKMKQLEYAISDTQKKLEGLKEARENLIKDANGNWTEKQKRLLSKLNGEIAVTEEELKKLQKEHKNFGSVGAQVLAGLGSKMEILGEKITQVGKKVSVLSGITGAALGVSIKTAMSWEDAWVGVTKTVDGTSEEMKNLENDLLEMASATGVSKSELAKFAEVAGQSGIAVNDIAKFTKTISDLNVATNILGEEGAQDISKIFNIMKIGIGDVDRFGSSLTALGNKFPTTEQDILNMATRMASTTEIVGLTGQELLALAATMTSLGSEAESGSTAITKMFKKIQLAISNNGEELTQFANVSNMTVEEFKELFETNALGALRAFAKGLNDTKENGGDVIGILDQMDLSEVRLSDNLLRLVGNYGQLDETLRVSNQSWEENYALAEEADKRYGTTTYRIQALREQFEILLIQIGEQLIPIIKTLIERVSNWLEKFNNLNDNTKNLIITVGIIITALGPLISAMGIIIPLIGRILKKIPLLVSGLKGLFALIMAHPVIAIATAIIGTLVLLYNKCEWFRNAVNTIVSAIWNFIKAIGEKIGYFFTKTIPSFIEKVKEVFSNLPYHIGLAMGYVLVKILQFGVNVWNWVTTELPKIINNIIDWFKSLPGRIWSALLETLAKLTVWLIEMRRRAREGISDLVHSIIAWFYELPGNIYNVGVNIVEGLWNGIRNAKDWLIGKVKSFALGIVDGMKSALSIHSPSAVFEKVIGKNIALGIGKGFDNSMVGVTKDMLNQINGLTTDVNLNAKGKGTATNNITLQFYPKQMTEGDLDLAFNYVNRRLGTAY